MHPQKMMHLGFTVQLQKAYSQSFWLAGIESAYIPQKMMHQGFSMQLVLVVPFIIVFGW
jgi:hypothetical protein